MINRRIYAPEKSGRNMQYETPYTGFWYKGYHYTYNDNLCEYVKDETAPETLSCAPDDAIPDSIEDISFEFRASAVVAYSIDYDDIIEDVIDILDNEYNYDAQCRYDSLLNQETLLVVFDDYNVPDYEEFQEKIETAFALASYDGELLW